MIKKAAVATAILVLGIAGCGAPPDTDPAEAGDPNVDSSPFDSMIDAVDDAEQLEETALRKKAEMDAALKRMEEGGQPQRR